MNEMTENAPDVCGDEIDVQEIMERIRETIRRRKEGGDRHGLPTGCEEWSSPDLSCLSNNADLRNTSYFISSHRPFAGKFLVRGRELVHGEVRRYVDPVFGKQAEFNGSAVRVLNGMNGRLDDMESRMDPEGAFVSMVREDVTRQILDVLDEIRAEMRGDIVSVRRQTDTEVSERVAAMKTDVTAMMKECLRREDAEIRAEISSFRDAVALMRTGVDTLVEEKVGERLAAMDAGIRDRAGLARALDQRVSKAAGESAGIPSPPPEETGLNYFVFEERFRGSRQDIMGRQEAFLPYFRGCRNVLDIGCGRGEFLELVREQGIGGRGVDIDDTMVDFCRSKGLDVEKVDAIAYLETLDDQSLDGIFIDQVVEHLEPAYLVRLLDLCCRKLQFGYYLVAGTVNPLSFVSLANFYIDLSHVRPVHPETLTFLFGAAGFREVEARFSSPVPDEGRLRRLSPAEGVPAAFVASYNRNIDLLNGVLYGAQDYAVIGKR